MKQRSFYNYLVGEDVAGIKDDGFVTVTPTSAAETQRLIDGLREGNGFIVDFERTDGTTAQRILDLLSGASYALKGRLTPLKNKMYLLLPRAIAVKRTKNEKNKI